MSEKKIMIEPDENIGAIKFQEQWRFFHEYLASWILDYIAYDSEVDNDNNWRGGLFKVDHKNAQEFIQYLQRSSKELSTVQIPRTEKSSFPGQQALLTFVINFDEQIFINGWHDNIAIEQYAPEGWVAVEDDPYNYVPTNIKALWSK